MNGRNMKLLGAAAIAIALIAACTTAPITGRSQLILTSEAQEAELGIQAYREVAGAAQLSKNKAWTAMVERVGKDIAAVAERPDFAWEFKLIADDTINAFCLPGGKVAFYEGIMPVCGTATGVAVVMGHEIGHAIARHGGERMSQGLLAEQGVGILSQIIGGTDPVLQQASAVALGAGVQYGAILPFGRHQETEADEIGVALMAKAGYDPREASKFWQRMVKATGGSSGPEWLSTHPAPETRIKALEDLAPKAMPDYEKSVKKD